MKAPFVCTLLAFCLCAGFSHSASAQSLTASHQEQAKFLLERIEQHLGKIKNFRCQKVTPVAPLPGMAEDAAPRYHHEWLAADRQGRGRIRTSQDGRITTQIWDGQKTIEHRTMVDPNGTTTHQVFIAKGINFPTQRHNEPWVYLGSDLANLLTEAVQGKHVVRVSQVNAGQYRLDIRDSEGAMHTAILDPQKGYAPIYRRLYAKGKIQILETIKFEQAGLRHPDIWFPVEVQTEIDPQGTRLQTPTLKCRFTEISVNNWDFEQTLRPVFAAGTRIYDRVGGQTYVVGEDTIEPLETPTPTTATAEPNTPASQTDAPPWRAAFDAAYQLEDGQNLKCLAPPFIPQRTQYLTSVKTDLAGQTDRAIKNRLYQFQWDNGLQDSEQIASNRFLELSSVLENIVGLGSYEYEGLPHLLRLPLTGDWIVRKNAPTDQLLKTLEQIVKDQRQWSIGFVKQHADAIVIRASGTYRFRAIPPLPADSRVHIYAGNVAALRGDTGSDNDCGTVAELLNDVAHRVGMRIIDDTQSSRINLCWIGHESAQLRNRKNTPTFYNTQLASLLTNLTNQTDLSFKIELGTVERWQVTAQRGMTARSN